MNYDAFSRLRYYPQALCILKRFSNEYSALHPSEIPVIKDGAISIDFLRNYVAHNFPVVYKNAVRHWPAFSKWNHSYLTSKLQNKKITVAVTPDGYADAVTNNKFMLPEEQLMSFDEFLVSLSKKNDAVYYIQKQNNNLFQEFQALADDIDSHIPWASDAFGKMPDAVNFWMGDEKAVSSLHKDHYENIYCVVKGVKHFILHPPVDAPWIPYETFKVGIYKNVEKNCYIEDLDQEVKWIPVNALCPDFTKYPRYKNRHLYTCDVEEGDVLYIPSLWYHHVKQSHGCIAVNYWYDMEFDVNYCNFKLLEELGELIKYQ